MVDRPRVRSPSEEVPMNIVKWKSVEAKSKTVEVKVA